MSENTFGDWSCNKQTDYWAAYRDQNVSDALSQAGNVLENRQKVQIARCDDNEDVASACSVLVISNH
ncbi:MAG: hypothetical protein ACXWTH_12890 [Methylosarcina sp.]